MFKVYSVLLFLLLAESASCQQSVKIYLYDCFDSSPLSNLNVKINLQTYNTSVGGRITLKDDFPFHLSVVDSKLYTIDTILLQRTAEISFCITPSFIQQEIEIVSPFTPRRELSATILDAKAIKYTSTILGEKDPIKTLQYLPGVTQGQEGSAQLFVRGGNSGENQILVDNVSLNQSGHLFGFISNINPNIVKEMHFYKGGFPAEYGNRLSSVIDIKTPTLDTLSKTKSDLTIGTVNTNFAISIPLFKSKAALLMTARTSPLSLFKEGYDEALNISERKKEVYNTARLNNYYIDSYNKLSIPFNKNLKIELSNLFSYDQLLFREKSEPNNQLETGRRFYGNANTSWLNAFYALQLIYSNSNRLKFALYANKYKQSLKEDDLSIGLTFQSRIFSEYINQLSSTRAGVKLDYYFNNYIKLYGGIHYENNDIQNKDEYQSFNQNRFELFNDYYHHVAAYIMAKGELLDSKLKINSGLRVINNPFLDENKFTIEPRINAEYKFNPNLSFLISASRMSQHHHILSRESVGIPYQIWVPASKNISQGVSDQISFGSMYKKKNIFASGEVFYKKSRGLLLPSQGQDIFIVNPYNFTTAKDGLSNAFGFEFSTSYFDKKLGQFELNYTNLHATLKFSELNNGVEFPSFSERRHNLNISHWLKISKKWEIKSTFSLLTGNPFTIPNKILPALGYENNQDNANRILSSVLKSEFLTLNLFNPEIYNKFQYDTDLINNSRTKIHHRLDLSFIRKREKSTLELGVYNVYFRKNPFITYLVTNMPSPSEGFRFGKRSLSLFNFIPYITYNYRFNE